MKRILPYLGEKILEAGAGTGNITRFLLQRASVTATDVHESSLKRMALQFAAYEALRTKSGMHQPQSQMNWSMVTLTPWCA